MRKWLIIFTLLLLLLSGGFYVAVKILMPGAAKTFVPASWQRIPLGAKKQIVHQYLGPPLHVTKNTDEWMHRLGNSKKYLLVIQYNQDSVAVKYTIMYEAKIIGYTQRTVIVDRSYP